MHTTSGQASDDRFDIDAREAEIVGKPQRIEPLATEEFDDDAKAMVANIRKSLRAPENVPIPEVFGVMIKHPGVFRCQLETGIQLVGKGAISRREQELAILRVGWLCRAPYEWGEHADIAKRYGVTAAEIERVTHGSAAAGWSEHERALLKAVEELLGEQMISDETWNVLTRSWSERQLIELPVLVGQYFLVALQQNALRIRLADNNAGLRQR